MNLSPGIVYTTKSIASHIYGAINSTILKRAERWIKKKSLNFNYLTAENICDEHNRQAKKQVITQVIKQHKTKRNILLFVKIVYMPEGETFLFANDSKGARRWIKFCSERPDTDALENVLTTLLEHEKKNTVIIPEGSLTTICRDLSRRWRSNEKKIVRKDHSSSA